MASYIRVGRNPNKKAWAARVKYRGIRHHLGYFETQEEAVGVEDKFKKDNNIDNSPHARQLRAAETRKMIFG